MSDAPADPAVAAERPVLRVVSPHATPEEVAALVAVLGSLAAPPAAPPRRTPEWSRPARMHRAVPPAGPGGWRASSLPR